MPDPPTINLGAPPISAPLLSRNPLSPRAVNCSRTRSRHDAKVLLSSMADRFGTRFKHLNGLTRHDCRYGMLIDELRMPIAAQ